MAQYRIQYAGQAEKVHAGMDATYRQRFDTEMQRSLGRNPYGHGSSPVRRGQEEHHRQITVAGSIVQYYVSDAVAVVTAVQVVRGLWG
ncbi:hypothetical protein ABT354_19675 [Streptomyces sp. NPDC000594]|uniref:hypothetical protein n=1 Tax=Streptomyces sp. NPDC000594 TaxID=3154261 RepID=UPI00332171B1